ncbi:hypothetical protein FRC03_009827 [Tulasnella sp. 419]|nr:hypothetical protein FRC03_009827 [Tulasnella sp. 419]
MIATIPLHPTPPSTPSVDGRRLVQFATQTCPINATSSSNEESLEMVASSSQSSLSMRHSSRQQWATVHPTNPSSLR